MGLWLRLSAFHSNCFLVSPGSCSIIFLWRKKKNTTQHKKLGRLSKVRYVTNLAQYPASPGDFYIVSYWVQGELRRRAYTGYIPQNNQKLDTVFSTFSLHNFGY